MQGIFVYIHPGLNWAVFALIAALTIAPSYTISRDGFGVPTVSAPSAEAAFEGSGYAVAQDRLWQLEMSRRLSEGRLAEVLGPGSLASDKDIVTLGYTPEEVDAQIEGLGAPAKAALNAYARGVNRWIEEATAAGTLPPGYATAGFKPAPWTVHDSASISIYLLRQFGRGGASELRDLAILTYLRGQPKVGDKVFDMMDDLAWLQDPKSMTTVAPEDDPVKIPPVFSKPTRGGTLSQLAELPKVSLFDLLPGLQIAERTQSKAEAQRRSVPFYTGSYCMVVSPKRSATGKPLLLSGPQMGFTNPSIVHELALNAPGMRVRGMDVPGAPGIVVGATPNFAWGLTSGVADVEDIFAFKSTSGDTYEFDGKTLPFTTVKQTIPVKDRDAVIVTQRRTIYGPVVIKTATGAFAVRSAFRGKELSTLNAFFELPAQKTAAAVDALIGKVPMSFNFFYAFAKGDTGYRYAGWAPLRNPSLDPRLPTPAKPSNDWRGMIPAAKMPHCLNPHSGLIVNWNTKPVSWWANGDTPVWGEIFRSTEILAALQNGNTTHNASNKLRSTSLANAVRTISQHDETWRYFAPFLSGSSATWAKTYDGSLTNGSTDAGAYRAFFESLRKTLFEGTTGGFLSPQYFDLVLQPTIMLRALRGETKFDFLAGRKPAEVIEAAIASMGEPKPYQAGGIRVQGEDPIPYSNRGTYIQLLEWLGSRWSMRTILPPGESESGSHRTDQAPLSRIFEFKPSVSP